MNPLLLALRAFYWALIAVAPALLAKASGKSYAEGYGALEFALLAGAALAVLLAARGGLALSRQLMLPALLALGTLGLALRAPPLEALERAGLGALCLSAALAAIASEQMLGGAIRLRFTGRVVVVTALGALGLVALLPLGLGRDSGTVFAGTVAGACVASLILAVARFETAFATARAPEVSARTRGLLLGAWLGLTALAAASIAAALLSLRASANPDASRVWLGARESARLGWSAALPIVAALVSVFAGRARRAGLAQQAWGDFSWALVAVALPATLGFGLLQRSSREGLTASNTFSARASASPNSSPSANPPATAEALAPAQTPEQDPAPSAEGKGAAVPSAAPPASKDADQEVGVEVSSAEGIYEEDARRSILRRVERAHECIRKNPSARGILSARVVVDAGGSVTNVVPLSGDLFGSAFAKCAMLWLYRVGFATPRSHEGAKFEVTLHFPGAAISP